MTVFEKIKNLLDVNNINYTLTEHEPVRTSEQAAKVRGVSLNTGVKAMVLKGKDNYYLWVLPADKKVDWKLVAKTINVKNIRFATEVEAEKRTHVLMGSVPPFGNILDISTYFDKDILNNEFVNFNPGSKTHSIQMKSSDLLNITNPKIF